VWQSNRSLKKEYVGPEGSVVTDESMYHSFDLHDPKRFAMVGAEDQQKLLHLIRHPRPDSGRILFGPSTSCPQQSLGRPR